MNVYLWEAGPVTGVTDDSDKALRLAADSMRRYRVARAVVETAHYDDDPQRLDDGYVDRGGLRWEARRHGSRITWTCRWMPAPRPEALAAS